VRRVPEGDGPVHRRDEADLRDATRCAPATLLRHPRRHPEGVASRGGTGRAGAGTAARGRLRPGGDLMSEEIVSELMRAHVYRLASTGQRVDIHVLDYDGNLFDACSYGAVAALASTVVPAKNLGLGEDFALPIEHWPVSVTTAKIKDLLLVDPSLDEERMADARITVTTDENEDIRAMQKGLSGSFSYDEVKRI